MDTRVCMVDSVEHFLSWPRCAGVRCFGETWRSTDQYDYDPCYGAVGHALRGNERCVSAVFFFVDVATQQKLERYHGRDRAQAVLIEAVGTSRYGHDMSSVCVERRVAAEREREKGVAHRNHDSLDVMNRMNTCMRVWFARFL